MTPQVIHICVLLLALSSFVYSQAPGFTDPSLLGGGQPLDPNLFNTGAGLTPGATDPSLFPNLVNPGLPSQFPPGPVMPAPLPRPNPMQAMLPMMLMRGGGDMTTMMLLMSMMGGGFGGGGGMASSLPFLMMMNNM